MQTTFDPLAVFTLFGVFQAILLAGVLAGLKRGYSFVNRLLAAFLATVSITFGGNVLTHTGSVLSVPHLAQISVPFGYLLAPLLFFYIKSVISRRSTFLKSDVLHLIPFFLCIAYLLPFYVQSGEMKIIYLKQALENHPLDWRIRTILGMTQQLAYLIWIFVLLLKRGNQENANYPIRETNFYLAKLLTIGFALVWIIGVIRFVLDYRLETNLIAPLIGCLVICVVVYKALHKPEVFSSESEPVSVKYEKSTLKPDEAENHLEKIHHLMKTEKPYLDKNLTLEKLARQLEILPPHLSQIINEKLNQNFADFINSYRIEEFKEQLADPTSDRYTIAAIAGFSGFNSKSTFNSAFKKRTNQTPSEFKKTLSPRN